MDIVNKVYKFKLFNDSVYFKIVFLLWALIHTLSFGPRITGYFSPIILLWGMILLFKNLIIEKPNIKKSYLFIIFAFLGAYILTIIFNRSMNIVGNTKTLLWTALMLLVIFLNEHSKNNKKIYDDIVKISIVIVVSTFILSFISVGMFCLDISYWVNRADGATIPQGYYAARLWGLYVDPNQGCTIGIISLVLSLVLIIAKNGSKKVTNILNVINIIIQYIFVVLTGSRGGEISLVFVIIGLVYLLGDYLLREKVKLIVVRSIAALLCGCIISVCIVLSFDGTRKILSNIPRLTVKTQQFVSEKTGSEIGSHEGNITVERPDVGGDLDVSNGRLTLWKDGFRLIKYSPVLGFGDRNIFEKAKELTPGSSLEKQFVHNGFIHMLLSGGVVAVVIMMILLVLIMINIIKVIFGINRYTKEYYIYSILVLIIGALLITTIFLTEIFYQNSFIATMFWIATGFVVVLSEDRELLEGKYDR